MRFIQGDLELFKIFKIGQTLFILLLSLLLLLDINKLYYFNEEVR